MNTWNRERKRTRDRLKDPITSVQYSLNEVTVLYPWTLTNSKIVTGIQIPSDENEYVDLPLVNGKIQLARIAHTGDPNHLIQNIGDYLIFNCGSSEEEEIENN